MSDGKLESDYEKGENVEEDEDVPESIELSKKE
jgi:hypothetical protein